MNIAQFYSVNAEAIECVAPAYQITGEIVEIEDNSQSDYLVLVDGNGHFELLRVNQKFRIPFDHPLITSIRTIYLSVAGRIACFDL